jgi:molecular chaperone GrpE
MAQRSDDDKPHGRTRPSPVRGPDIDPELADDMQAQFEGELPGEQALADAQEEAARNLATAQKWQAEFENYRKRQERDVAELRARAGERIVVELLPVLDDLDRALDHAIQSSEAGAELEQLIKGMEMVRDRILTVFGKEGVETIDPFGQSFDPHLHHAVGQREDQELAEHTVMEVYQKGYNLGGRVIRPAMVVVSSREPAPAPEE